MSIYGDKIARAAIESANRRHLSIIQADARAGMLRAKEQLGEAKKIARRNMTQPPRGWVKV